MQAGAVEMTRSSQQANERRTATAAPEDPAERGGYLRFFYRNWRPTPLGRAWTRAFAWLAGLGVLPELVLTLQVRDRRSGRLTSTILAVAGWRGDRYLVSMLRDRSEWVQNVRAAGGAAFIKRGRAQPVVLTEIPPDRRAPILKAWARVATSGRRHLPVAPDAPVEAFEAIAADYPAFRIDPARPQPCDPPGPPRPGNGITVAVHSIRRSLGARETHRSRN